MAEKKLFKRSEITERNVKNDAVFIIDNKVYDVTKFLDDHPGGHEVLMNVAGKDATEDFDDIGHSIDAKEMMIKFLIGEVVEEDKIFKKKSSMSWGEASVEGQDSSSGFLSSWKLPVVLGLVMTVLYTYLFG